jgi:hypothetical protein
MLFIEVLGGEMRVIGVCCSRGIILCMPFEIRKIICFPVPFVILSINGWRDMQSGIFYAQYRYFVVEPDTFNEGE